MTFQEFEAMADKLENRRRLVWAAVREFETSGTLPEDPDLQFYMHRERYRRNLAAAAVTRIGVSDASLY